MKCLITGATSGLGLEFAKQLKDLGYELILIGRNKKKLESISKLGKTIYCDLSKKEEVLKLCKKLDKENIDMIINNAGIGVYGEFKDTDIDKELEMINTNIISLHILTKHFYKKFLKLNKGTILNVSSTATYSVGPFMSSYYASKSYVYKLTRAIQKENKSNVRINLLLPGPVYTDFNKKMNINFSVKAMTPSKVVSYTLQKLYKNKEVIVPGFKNRLSILLIKLFPESLITRINYKIQSKKVTK